jgi:hypothetical protein
VNLYFLISDLGHVVGCDEYISVWKKRLIFMYHDMAFVRLH